MSGTDGHVTLVDAEDVADLGTFLARARRLDASAVRLHAQGAVLAVTVCAMEGHGLMGEGTVLGLRAFALAEPASCDVVVGIDAVQDRLARLRSADSPGPQRVALPPVPVIVPWAGLAPPRSGWEPRGQLAGELVAQVAQDGIAEVASVKDPATRDAVWHRALPDSGVPSGAALAVHALGFTAPQVQIFGHGRWWRLSTPSGHVLCR
ncbi:hypothetical protein [Mobilicoccus caccae]|uniref:Uncharacterized protein n=1 Tax=Mobilicoccus caccae TaxID=1859295 RepID=A0ABQ6IQW5_9MICO|nr:hypothetical protein [Mobilicoccus caccae]GMA39078.1 hypothetical protein GCM10025883_11230 [Mobilicoccus caccae]